MSFYTYEGCPSKSWTLIITHECVQVIVQIFKGCVYRHIGNILYKHGWNRSLDKKSMNPYLTVCPRERRTSNYFQ